MIFYLDRDVVPDVENINPEVLRYVVEKAVSASGRYENLRNYYTGRCHMAKAGADEVQVIVNYPKYIVDVIRGYFLGDPIKYDANNQKDIATLGDESTLSAGDKIDISPLLDVYDRQDINSVDAEIGKCMGIYGDCLELVYASTDNIPVPRSVRIRPENGILVCDTTVEHKKLFGVLWERREGIDKRSYYFITVYTDRTERDFKAEKMTSAFAQVGQERNHFFGDVPVISYENNAERQGDFEQIISLIDAYDQLMSDRLTDKRKFVDALLVFFGMTLRDGDEQRLAKEKFLDGAPLDAKVEYIQKTFDESSVQVLADALVREIHKMSLTVDMSDEKFSGNASGQALKLKLLTMNMMVKNKMRQMERGLRERWKLYNTWLSTAGRMQAVDISDVDIRFTISLPIDESAIVDIVTKLQGIVDDQTLLGLLWFVRDPAEALDNIKAQKAEAAAEYRASLPNRRSEEDYLTDDTI